MRKTGFADDFEGMHLNCNPCNEMCKKLKLGGCGSANLNANGWDGRWDEESFGADGFNNAAGRGNSSTPPRGGCPDGQTWSRQPALTGTWDCRDLSKVRGSFEGWNPSM